MPTSSHSIVVYTNPYARDFYESGMMIPLLGGLVSGLVVFVILCTVFGTYVNRNKGNVFLAIFAIFSLLAGGIVFSQLTI